MFADGIAQPQDIVSLQITPPSDFNNDGYVDAADYVVWRKFGGTQEQYNTWTSSFGVNAASSVTGPAIVPEPDRAALLSTFLASAFAWKRLRRRHRWISAGCN